MRKQTGKIIIRKLILYLMLILIGFMFGCMFVYKVEINTINQALDSLSYCYETYAVNDYNYKLKPCACCGEFCMAKDCNMSKSYQIDSIYCRGEKE